jgi:hypothetical protein
MSVIGVLNMVVGGVVCLAGLFQLVGTFVLMFELLRVGAFTIPLPRVAFALLILATGVVGIIAGIGMLGLRSWARRLSLVFGAPCWSCRAPSRS